MAALEARLPELDLASGLSTFRTVATAWPEYQALVGWLQAAPQANGRALYRYIYSLQLDMPAQGPHPHDKALAVYLMALATVPPVDCGWFWTRLMNEQLGKE